MLKNTLDDTIAAISTPIGQGGIGIIRLSGKDALAVADKVFMAKAGKRPSSYKTYTVHYGWIVNSPQKKKNQLSTIDYQLSTKIIDEVLLTVMRAPRSYTKEDIVEISCHSGIVVLREILDLVLGKGARLAEAGEFTKRAFLNGRIDLSKAEAVMDIINAKTNLALESGIKQLKGQLSVELNRIKKELLEAIALLEANIDFPEEEIESAGLGNGCGYRKPHHRPLAYRKPNHGPLACRDKKTERIINSVSNKIDGLLKSATHGKILRDGLSAVILGRANVGKSSLLNALLKEERAIVSPIAGTTRDAIEEIIDIQGIPLKIADTAGIIEPKDLIEKEALKRTRNYLNKANLVLLVLDASKKLAPDDRILFKKVSGQAVIVVLNKSDLKVKIEQEEILGHFPHLVRVSSLKGLGLRDLEEKIIQLCWEGRLEASDEIILTNSRHIRLLTQAKEALDRAWNSLEEGLSIEYVAEDLRLCRNWTARITGEEIEDDILDKIFSEFCVGK